jgi:plasmid stability protein
MAAVTIRNLDDRIRERLRIRAARHGRSMEAEMRAILADAVCEPGENAGLLHAFRQGFGKLGGVELEIPPRGTRPRAADFE